MASTDAPAVLAFLDSTDAPNGRRLTTTQGLHVADFGPGSDIVLSPSDRLASLATMTGDGMVSFNATTKAYTPRQLTASNGIIIANPNGIAGNPTISVLPQSSVQLLNFANAGGSVQSTAPQVNFQGGTGISVSVTDVGGGSAANVTISSSGTTGTVTSVGVSSSDLTVSGSPITTTGTIALTLNTVPTTKGGLGQTAYTAGDTVYYASGTAFTKLAIGLTHTLMYSTGSGPAWMATQPTSGQALTYNGTNLVWTTLSGTGTVTSIAVTSSDLTVGGSPITTSGTVTLALNTVTTAKGGSGLTTYTAGDTTYFATGTALTKLAIGAANTLMFSTGTAPAWMTAQPASGNVLSYDGTNLVWAAPAGTGTVTSIAVTSGNAFLGVSGSPITTSGTIALTIGTLALANGGLGAAYPTSSQGSIAGYLASDTRLRPISAGTGNPNSMLRADTSGNPQWTAAASITGQVMVIGPSTQGATWCNNPTANGQILTYVNSGTGVVWQAPTAGGTVSSVAVTSSDLTVGGSPITTTGTITLALNTVGTALGGSGLTSYTAGDTTYYASGASLTKLAIAPAHSVMYSTGTAPAWTATQPTMGQSLVYDGTNLIWTTATGGTVTSVAVTSSDLTVGGSPITTTGTVTLALNTVTTAKGGTGVTTYAAGDTTYYATGTALSKLTIGLNHTLMYSTGTAPAWMTAQPATGNFLKYDGTNLVWLTPVTSVATASPNSTVTLGGSPVTTTGTLNFDVNIAGLMTQLFSTGYAGTQTLSNSQSSIVISSSKIQSNSNIFVGINISGLHGWNVADNGIRGNVIDRNAGANFTIQFTQPTSSATVTEVAWLIINP